MKRARILSLLAVLKPTVAQFVAVLALIVTAFVAYNLGARGGHGPHDSTGEPAMEHVHEEENGLLGYACAMNCVPPLEEPGECPICGMEMQPVFADSDDDSEEGDPQRRMTMSREALALARIQTATVERGRAVKELRLSGELALNPARRTRISADVGGRIDRLFADYVGATVEQGADLVELYSPELLAVQREFLQAIRSLERHGDAPQSIRNSAESAVRAARERLRLAGLTSDQIDRIAESGEATDRVTLKAPVGGIVVERPLEEGSYVAREGVIIALADLSVLWAELDAFESDLPWLRAGQSVRLQSEAHPGESFEGEITFVEPIMQRGTRTARVRVDVENPDGQLKPGMYLTGIVEAELEDERPLLVPHRAPLITGRRAVVYIEVPDRERPTFEGREIVLGPRTRDGYIVREGLQEGERVVTNGAFRIDSALQIQARPSMMSPEGGQPVPGHDHGHDDGHDHDAMDRQINDDPHADHNHAEEAEAPDGDPDPARLAGVLRAYLALQTALAGDDLDAAQQAASRLAVAGRARDFPHVGHLAADAAQAENIDAVREAFHPVSEQIIELLRHHGNGTGLELHSIHCPMAFDDAGADWVQEGTTVRNPYYGAQMLRCGTPEEEFAAQ